jgi:hypothetical protein
VAAGGATDSSTARLHSIFKAFDDEDGLVLTTLCKLLEVDVRLLLVEVHKNDQSLQQLK